MHSKILLPIHKKDLGLVGMKDVHSCSNVNSFTEVIKNGCVHAAAGVAPASSKILACSAIEVWDVKKGSVVCIFGYTWT